MEQSRRSKAAADVPKLVLCTVRTGSFRVPPKLQPPESVRHTERPTFDLPIRYETRNSKGCAGTVRSVPLLCRIETVRVPYRIAVPRVACSVDLVFRVY